MPDRDSAAEDDLATLREAYKARLRRKVGEIDEIRRLVRRGGWDNTALAAVQAIAHNFAGSGATFGFAALSEASAPLDQLADDILRAQALPSEAECEQLARMIDAVRAACSTAASPTTVEP